MTAQMQTSDEIDQMITQAMAQMIREALPHWPEPRTSIETKLVFDLDGVDYYVTLTVQLGKK